MADIAERAEQQDMPAIVDEKGYENETVRRLVRLCRELQREAGSKPFFLDCRTAARHVGTDHTTAWRFLRMLCADGVLECVQIGQRRKATEYRYQPPLES